jgi:hypothetical protein
VSAQDPLAEFFVSTPRGAAGATGRDGTHGAVDEALDALRVPATLDGDGDWRFESDVGPFLLVLDRANGDLVLLQTIRTMEQEPSSYADDMHFLLLLNLEAEGARFAALKDGEMNLLVLTSRLEPEAVRTASVEAMLVDAMSLSRRLDELVDAAS